MIFKYVSQLCLVVAWHRCLTHVPFYPTLSEVFSYHCHWTYLVVAAAVVTALSEHMLVHGYRAFLRTTPILFVLVKCDNGGIYYRVHMFGLYYLVGIGLYDTYIQLYYYHTCTMAVIVAILMYLNCVGTNTQTEKTLYLTLETGLIMLIVHAI